MKTNLQEQLDWLRQNFEVASLTGFHYAHVASDAHRPPIIFKFESAQAQLSQSCTISSITESGNIDLESFRKDAPPVLSSGPITFPPPAIPPQTLKTSALVPSDIPPVNMLETQNLSGFIFMCFQLSLYPCSRFESYKRPEQNHSLFRFESLLCSS
jgi:hypothetical protein